VQFSVAGANVNSNITINTASITNGYTLMANSNSQIAITYNGPTTLNSSQYVVANLNPVTVTFLANSLPANATVIITTQTNFFITSTSPANILLSAIPNYGQIVQVGGETANSWYATDTVPLQLQNTAAAEFFRNQL
jgi:hypothetical protein